MAGSKLPPRQKMINMMYLVLTAILALNVTSEVLNAFKTVDDGIGQSNHSLQVKTAGLFNEFNVQMDLDKKKAEPFKLKADEAEKISTLLYDQLEQYKQQVIKEAGGYDPKTGQLVHNDDIDIATRIFVEQANGKKLRENIQKTREQLLALSPEEDRNSVAASIPLSAEESKDQFPWEFHKFNQVPTVAAVTLLSKYQNDVLASENQLVEYFYKKIDAKSVKVDRLTALVSSPSNYIMQGLPYKANIMLTAYSSTQNPDVFIGSFNGQVKKNENGNYNEITSASETPPLSNPQKVDVSNGLGKIQMQGSNVGESHYTGVIRVKDPSGSGYKFYPFEGEYQVAAKSAVVSPTSMNVLYAGLENPVTVSVPGVAQRDVSAAFDGPGVLQKKTDGSYTIRPSGSGKYKVKVSAKVNGSDLSMGEMIFRVKRVPDPMTTLDGKYFSGNMSLPTFKSTSGIVPKIDLELEGARFEVLTYTAVAILTDGTVQKYQCAGPMYSKDLRNLIDKGKIKKGCTVVFEDIAVKDPEGKRRTISPVAIAVTSN